MHKHIKMDTDNDYKSYLEGLSHRDLKDIFQKINGDKYPDKKRMVEDKLLSIQQDEYSIFEQDSTQSKSSLTTGSFIRSVSIFYLILLVISTPIIVSYLNQKIEQPSSLSITALAFFFILSGTFISGIQQLYITGLAFQKSAGRGIVCLFIPFSSLSFVSEDQEAARAFIKSLFGIPFVITGILLITLTIKS